MNLVNFIAVTKTKYVILSTMYRINNILLQHLQVTSKSKWANVSSIARSAIQAAHAVFLPIPENDETISHPVMAGNIGRPLDFVRSNIFAIVLTSMYLQWAVFPHSNYTCPLPKLCVIATTILTRTSVSTVLINMFLKPFSRAWCTWRSILMSASKVAVQIQQ